MKTKTIPLKRYKKYKKLLKLVKEWTRAEVMARSPITNFPAYAEYFTVKIDKEDEIRELLFGTSNLIEIGDNLGLTKAKGKKRVTKTKNKKLRESQRV